MTIPWSKEQLMKANAKLMVKNEELQNENKDLNEQLMKYDEDYSLLKTKSEKQQKEIKKWKRAYHKIDPVGFTFNEPLKD